MEIPHSYKLRNTVYHYTKLSTSIENILDNGSLRLSPRKGTNDPYENQKKFIQYSSFNYEGAQIAKIEQAAPLIGFIHDWYNSIKQISFCMNEETIPIERQTGYGDFEYYGFLKPRMWDQYGDSYKGVCLAFSLDKILEGLLNSGIHNTSKKVSYEKANFINSFDYGIDMNRLEEMGSDEFLKDYFRKSESKLFTKFHDYKDETEFRICAYSEDEFIPFEITDSLIGIIYCEDFTPMVYNELLIQYAQRYNANLTAISFSSGRLNVKNKLHAKISMQNEGVLGS